MKRKIRCSAKLANKYVATKKVQAAGFDAEAFRQRHEAAAERKASKLEDKKFNIVNEIRESNDPMEKAAELLVPSSGMAETKAGELVRAMMRILYRYSNDGDLFYSGYGIETCGDAVAFLCKNVERLEDDFGAIADKMLEDDEYTAAIIDISDEVLDYIYSNPDLVTEPNDEDMYDSDGESFIRDSGWEPLYETSSELPDNVLAHVDAGDIDEGDVISEVESWFEGNAEVSFYGDMVHVSNLTADQFDEIDGYLYGWLDNYGDDLDLEYGTDNDDEDDDEED